MKNERLTNVGTKGEIWIIDNDETRRYGSKETAYKKLAEYEDLDDLLREKLTDDAVNIITASKKDFSEWIDRILWTNKRCDELAREVEKYRELEEQGLVMRLPCKVGSTVYSIYHLPLSKKSKILEVANVDMFFLLLAVAENKFGKTVFLKQAEAEEKLRELQEREEKQ